MALPMSSPYRGYAAVTHDTNRIAEVITELNALNTVVGGKASSSHNHDGSYTLTPGHTFVDATSGDGTGTVFTIGSGTWPTFVLNVENIDTQNAFNTGTYIFTVPANGTYYCTLRARVLDSHTTAGGLGLGIHTSNSDGPFFQWYEMPAISRKSFWYERIAVFSASDQVRAYCYQDTTGGGIPISRGHMQIWRLA